MTGSHFTRRALAPLALGGLAAGLEGCDPKATADVQPNARQFPPGFKWGVATAAFQTEGALQADGRGPTIWDTFSAGGAHIKDHSTAAIATDSYHRFGEDVDLIAGAGLKAYRFSVGWSRIQPTGQGAPNPAGIDFYSRLVDAQLKAGVEPYATLFHWDLPQALQDRGGWLNRDTTARFADYAAIMADKLGDRLKNFITLNEAAVHCVIGHVVGVHAPGLKGAANIGPVTHHQNLAQGMAIQALRAHRGDLKIGATLALQPCRPTGGLPWNKLASDGLDELWNRAYLDPLLKGSYPKGVMKNVEPVLKDGDLKITRQPVDFVGVNYYSPTYLGLDLAAESHIAPGKPPKGVELDAFGRHIDPAGLAEVLGWLRKDYGNPHVIITENGCSDPISQAAPAIQNDTFRITYLRRHLEAVKTAMEAGSPVDGYFVWSIIDNWEWDSGFSSKFGLVSQAGPGGARAPKASYAWFKALAQSGLLPTRE
jgi:beta-glucosidase